MSDDFDFHYKREERLARHSAPRPRPSSGFLPGNRRSSLLFLNLVIIVVLLALYGRLIAGGGETARLAGCRLALHAASDGDAIEAVLEADVVDAAAAGKRLFVVFAAGQADLRLAEVLPDAGGRIALRGRLDAAGAEDVHAEVSVGGKSIKMRVVLDHAGGSRR
jgi:hypothetical protein